MFEQESLALIYIALMGLSIILYAILDGYDLGVGILLPLKNKKYRNTMIASIGPFWDANETWLVLAIGILLVAFPAAHSEILRLLYLPISFMLIALILRGVAFDFRAKAAISHQALWDKIFKFASLVTALCQGYMLGQYVTGFSANLSSYAFSLLSAFGVAAAYSLIGATWLIMKTQGAIQFRTIRWAKIAMLMCLLGVVLVSIVNPLINPGVFDRWFSGGGAYFLLLLPLSCFSLFFYLYSMLKRPLLITSKGESSPFFTTVAIFILCFSALCFSYFPYIIPGKMTIWQSVSAPESLNFLLWGTLFVIPCILAYTVFSYRVFWGKVEVLRYY